MLRSVNRMLLALTAGALTFAAAPSQAGVLGYAAREAARALEPHRSVSVPPASGTFGACADLFPRGRVIDPAGLDPAWKTTALCSSHFAVLFSALSKTPLVVVERLNQAQMASAMDEKRTNEFYADSRLAYGKRAELDDYRGSGFDRGHMSPAGDQPDPESMAQSFALSNMIPQDPFNNRKTWAKIESDVRKYVRRTQGNVFVFTGPIFVGQLRTIGRDAVWVPTSLFKLVYDETSGRAWAYILDNTAEARISAPVDYATFFEQTKLPLLGVPQ